MRAVASSVAVGVGVLLLALQVVGLSRDPVVRPDPAVHDRDPIPGYDFPVLDRTYLDELFRNPQAQLPLDVSDWNDQVFLSMHHSDSRRISIFENWIWWSCSWLHEPCGRTQNTSRLIAGGAGDCSERALVLKSIAEKAGLSCRFVGLQGHVVLELHTPQGWQVADPDYGVTYPMGIADLQSDRGAALIRDKLAARGFPAPCISEYVHLIRTVDDNVTLEVGSSLSPRLAMIESLSDWLAWIVPCMFVMTGGYVASSLRKTFQGIQRLGSLAVAGVQRQRRLIPSGGFRPISAPLTHPGTV